MNEQKTEELKSKNSALDCITNLESLEHSCLQIFGSLSNLKDKNARRLIVRVLKSYRLVFLKNIEVTDLSCLVRDILFLTQIKRNLSKLYKNEIKLQEGDQSFGRPEFEMYRITEKAEFGLEDLNNKVQLLSSFAKVIKWISRDLTGIKSPELFESAISPEIITRDNQIEIPSALEANLNGIHNALEKVKNNNIIEYKSVLAFILDLIKAGRCPVLVYRSFIETYVEIINSELSTTEKLLQCTEIKLLILEASQSAKAISTNCDNSLDPDQSFLDSINYFKGLIYDSGSIVDQKTEAETEDPLKELSSELGLTIDSIANILLRNYQD